MQIKFSGVIWVYLTKNPEPEYDPGIRGLQIA